MSEPTPLREVTPMTPTCCGAPMKRIMSPSGKSLFVCARDCGRQQKAS